MKSLWLGLVDLPRAVGLLLQALYHFSIAMRNCAIANRIKADKQLYELLTTQALSQAQKQELKQLVKNYKQKG